MPFVEEEKVANFFCRTLSIIHKAPLFIKFHPSNYKGSSVIFNP
uniref:Uncharacterized protein n=1 Tax=uncultured nuHF1 cluster bacterium HF0130_31E21 TaxID=710728 RepID=E0XTJ8_9BACT|nr:hypothetical protein [uncultured nuHF1 cluster bacterium HF0130_31E21]